MTMPRTSPRTILMLTLILAVLPFGVAMASDGHNTTSSNGSPGGENSGTTKTDPTKTDPTKTDETNTDGETEDSQGSDDATGPATTSTTEDNGGSEAGDDNGNGSGADNGGAADTPKPQLGHTVVLSPGQGTVKVHAPGDSSWHSAAAAGSLPVGAVVDATHGHVTLQTAVDAQGDSQSATFWGGRFQIRQAPHGVTELVLDGPKPHCGTGAVTSASRTSGLWGHDHHGKFRTRGRNAVATVRGTTWYVGERCGGTFTKVATGAVRVWDRHTHHTVVLHAGQSHLSRSRG
jgi:hypothetical protein